MRILSRLVAVPALALFCAIGGARADDLPAYTGAVNDFTGQFLTAGQIDELNRKIHAFQTNTSIQIAVCIEASLNGASEFDRSLAIARKWGPGDKKQNNGVLLYVAVADRALFIQTGFGSEGFLPDAIAKRIVENVLKPQFREGKYFEGIAGAVDAIMRAGAGEYPADASSSADASDEPIWPGLIVVLLVFGILVWLGRKNGWKGGGKGSGMSRGGGIGGGGFSGGGGGGGFGGGGFGGGGAGGRW